MKFSGLSIVSTLVAALGGVAVAQDCVATALTAIPACAQPCFLNGAPSVGCGGTDFHCQCEKQAALFAAVEGCVSSGCPTASYQAVIDGASTVCGCAVGAATAPATAGGTVAPSITGSSIPATTRPTTVPTAAASRPRVVGNGIGMGFEVAVVAGVVGSTLFAALAL